MEGEINDHEDREGRPGIVVIHVNDHEDRDGATDVMLKIHNHSYTLTPQHFPFLNI